MVGLVLAAGKIESWLLERELADREGRLDSKPDRLNTLGSLTIILNDSGLVLANFGAFAGKSIC